MKKRFLSLLLTLCLAAGLAVPASAAGGYGPLTLQFDRGSSVTFSAATVERKTVQSAHYEADNSLGPYTSVTVNLVKLQPGSTVTVQNGYRDDFGNYGVISGSGEYLSDSRFTTFYTGAVMVSLRHGKAEASFDKYTSMCFIYWPDEPYYVVMGPSVGSSGFSDVADSDYFAQPVQWAVSKGITNGTGTMTFSPNQTCTFAQITTFLHRANGSPAPTISSPYGDVSPKDYYYVPAVWAAEKGLATGGEFYGSTQCRRGSVVLMLWILAGRPDVGKSSFTDVPAETSLSKAVAWAVSKGITNGTTKTTFSPDKICTRGEIVTFLYRAYGA